MDGYRPSIVFEVWHIYIYNLHIHTKYLIQFLSCYIDLVFQVPPPEDGKIKAILGVFFKCNDSCGECNSFFSNFETID